MILELIEEERLKQKMCTINLTFKNWSFLLWFILPVTILAQNDKGFAGSLKYDFHYFYETAADSIYFTNRFKSFFEKTGFEINKTQKGHNIFFIQKDTLLEAQFDDDFSFPIKYKIQKGLDAIIYNPTSESFTNLNQGAIERIFDRHLIENWRDSINIKSIARGKKGLHFKKIRGKEKILDYTCNLYRYEEEDVETTLWITKEIVPSKEQLASPFFDRIFFRGGTILKSIAKYKGYVVVKEILDIKISSVNNLDEAIQQLDYKKVNLNN